MNVGFDGMHIFPSVYEPGKNLEICILLSGSLTFALSGLKCLEVCL